MRTINFLLVLMISVLILACSKKSEGISAKALSPMDSINQMRQTISELDQELKLIRKEYEKENHLLSRLLLKTITDQSQPTKDAAEKQKAVVDSITSLGKVNRANVKDLEARIAFLNSH